MDASRPAAHIAVNPEVSIIIPARNEEANLGACLQSLVSQTGVAFEIIVVDDASTDHTAEIARSFLGVLVISSPPLPEGWTGKNNAVIAGAKAAHGNWLLFTDADTIHLPGSLARAIDEAKREQADLLSYSPEQIVVTFSERAVMPVVFSELAVQYPLHKVREQSDIVAANGQYILVRREAYEVVGSHAAVASEILEDVALARRFRADGKRIYFRYGADAVRTRMYRNWVQLREGWTKNLTLLFPHSRSLAWQSLFRWFAACFAVFCAMWFATEMLSRHNPSPRQIIGIVLAVILWARVYFRIRTAHFSFLNNLIAVTFGLPIFAYLLRRSNQAHSQGQVSWKGRAYGIAPQNREAVKAANHLGKIKHQKLRTESR